MPISDEEFLAWTTPVGNEPPYWDVLPCSRKEAETVVPYYKI